MRLMIRKSSETAGADGARVASSADVTGVLSVVLLCWGADWLRDVHPVSEIIIATDKAFIEAGWGLMFFIAVITHRSVPW